MNRLQRFSFIAPAAVAAVMLAAALPAADAAPAKGAAKQAAAPLPNRVEVEVQVARLWRTRSFDGIEALDAAYSHPDKVDADGFPLRDALDQSIRSQLAAVAGVEAEWNDTRDAIYRWIDGAPQSALAHVTLANLYAARAWQIRGTGPGSTVSQAQWDGFQANLQKERTVLESSRGVAYRHPAWYLSMARVLQWTSAPEPEFRTVLADGLERFPASFALYAAAIDRYSWKWGGQSGQGESFARQASARLPAQQGDELYARAFGYTAQEYPSETFGFDCARVLRGFDQIVGRYKTPLNTHHAARAAFECKDRTRLRKLLRGAGETPPAGVWGYGPQGLDRYKEARKLAK